MDYILFGIQGSGKGTQGKILQQKLGASYFETGGELRRLSAENSALGKKVKSIINAGHLVPTEVVMEIVENFAKNAASGMHATKAAIIFDGIPRNAEQNELFEKLLQKMGRQYKGIYFELSRQEAENRLLKRRVCASCKKVYPAMHKGEKCLECGGHLVTRADDNAESIRTRLDIFFKETLPIIEQWEVQGKIIKIDASGTIEEVTKNLQAKI